MRTSSLAAETIVIDASVAVWTVLPIVSQVDAVALFVGWRQARTRLVAPALWLAESVSAIRGVVAARVISSEEGRDALDDLFSLEVEVVAVTEQHGRTAFSWAERLGQSRAYDGFYLALAEELGAEFWTADRRLANSARRIGISWVHPIS